MGKLPGISHQRAIRALERAGFEIIRQGGHISMSDGIRLVIVPRNNPIDAVVMFKIVRDAGLTVDEFRKLL